MLDKKKEYFLIVNEFLFTNSAITVELEWFW